jgi:SAM-dependent methyltransferase
MTIEDPMSDMLVQEFYTQHVRGEWRRLVKDAYHRLEFDTTLYFLQQYLPAQGLILDAGGGPGRYTVELAGRGYDVVLLDATPANIEFARRQVKRRHLHERVRQVLPGSMVDLSVFPDATFDAVLCSGGPLSHILDPELRKRAISELVRVTKPGGHLFVSVMGRLSVLVVCLMISPDEIAMPHFDLIRTNGDYLGGHGFTACHFFLPDELREAFTLPGVEVLEMAGLEGISANHRKELKKLARDGTLFPRWLETHFATCTHPAVVATSEHMLIICRKV